MTEQHPSTTERLAAAYNRMMERLRERMEGSDEAPGPTLDEGIKQAGNKAVELGELSREEAEKIGGWIKRDIEEATLYLGDSGREFADWLKFDVNQVEERLLDALLSVADRTKLELAAFERSIGNHHTYHAGEVTGAGVLECLDCGEPAHFYATAMISACANCGGTKFRRPRA